MGVACLRGDSKTVLAGQPIFWEHLPAVVWVTLESVHSLYILAFMMNSSMRQVEGQV